MTRVRLEPFVSRKIGSAGLSRTGLLRLIGWLYDELEHRADEYQHNRVPGKPDHFLVRKVHLDNGTVHKFVFSATYLQPDLLVVDECRRGT